MSYEASLTGSTSGLAGPAWLLAAVWWGALGAIVGSFLNVVVYRLPRGLSLIWPGSHCPACQHPIRWYDNVPVLGWLMLGGRCRDCDASISPRYPIVEAVTSMVFLTVAITECLSGGSNLPTDATSVTTQGHHSEAGIFVLWGITLFHLTLLGTLLPAALIHYDGQRLPWRWASPSLLIGLLASILWPTLHPVTALPHLSGPWTGMLDGMSGLLVGTAAGLLAAWRVPPGQRREVVIAAGMVGLYLGWQLGAGVVLAAALLYQVCRSMSAAGQPRVPLLAWLTALSFVGVIFWRQLDAIWPWTH